MERKLNNYQVLIEKLDRFIRKYYINRIIRGSILFGAVVLAFFLIFNLLENEFYFSRTIRKSIFYGFIGISLLTLLYFVLIPLGKYFRLGRVLSHNQAAKIIGNHFSGVKDKLLNVLQLFEQSQTQSENELLFAGIDQKSNEIKLVPFRSAVNYAGNRKYLKYLIPPALILFFIMLFAPGIINSSTQRIIKNQIDFEKPAPFSFTIINDDLEAVQYSDMELRVRVTGDYVPADAYIDIDNFQYRLLKSGNGEFAYTFKNVQDDLQFNLYSGRVRSNNYELKVIPKPVITDFSVLIDYPAYTGQQNEIVKNKGDLLILEGSILEWDFNSLNTDLLKMSFQSFQDKLYDIKASKGSFSFQKRITDNDVYKIFIHNNRIPVPDSVSYTINVIKDKFPTINVEQIKDSVDNSMIFFIGNVSDDYGISSLTFNYRITERDGNISEMNSRKINSSKEKSFDFNYLLDFSEIGLKPGQTLRYFFEVRDNDGINGPKSSFSTEMEYRTMTFEEFEQNELQNEQDIKDNLEEIQMEAQKIRDKLKELKEKLLQKPEPEWQDRQELEKLLEREKELLKKIEETKNKLEENLKKQNEFREADEQILEKQEQLQKMFDELLSEEQKDLMRKIEELLMELNKGDMMQQMDEMNLDSESLQKQMDRMLELFKQLELEKKMTEAIDELSKLSEKQEELSEDTKNESKSQEELLKEQEELNKEFEKTKDKVEELMEKNKELERPKNLAEDNEEKMDEIKQDMDDSMEKMEGGQNQDASQQQKNAAQKMQKMANSLNMQMQGSAQEQHEEDMKSLRQLLSNLLTLSFEQEDLMLRSRNVIVNSPAYNKILREQNKIKQDFRIVEDSLQALSKRVMEIQTFVNDKVKEIKLSIDQSIESLLDDSRFPGTRDFDGANKAQHNSMKNLNDLALMLDESMQQMQQNAAGMPGSGSCKKKGGQGSEPMDMIIKGQEKLSDKLKEMLGKMQNKDGKGGSAKEFAESAKQQAELRKALEDLRRQQQEQGQGAGNELQQLIDDMNKLEEDLVNRRLDSELLKRQQEITTRLLEADKAQRTRGFDTDRESRTASETERKLPPAIEEYLRERESQLDQYRPVSPALKPFYRDIVREYIENMKNNT